MGDEFNSDLAGVAAKVRSDLPADVRLGGEFSSDLPCFSPLAFLPGADVGVKIRSDLPVVAVLF
jgi:hypothetical protein